MSDDLQLDVAGPTAEQDRLFDVDPDWKDTWKGLPDYEHQNLMPWQTVLVHFKTEKDRADFARLVGQQLNAKTKFIWHPKAEIRKAADKVWTCLGVPREQITPRHPVYIISKGRWDSRLTSRALEWTGVPYHIVVEPQEYDRYAAVIDPKKILTLPFSNLGLGGIPARNWVWEHSVAAGAKRHWILDDNISGFCRFYDNLKVEVDSGVLFRAIEDFVDRYENIAMAGFNYDYFAPRKRGSKIKPITFNTRIYSGILLSNALSHRWRGRYNEDTDLSLRILKDGMTASTPGRYATALFNAFLMYKKPTLTMKGGNTDELYKGVEATAAEYALHAQGCGVCKACMDGYDGRLTPCEAGRQILSKDGRWLMAESLREQHPDCTTVERKWGRWQHQVDYRAFERNALIPKDRASVSEEPNDYGMVLAPMPPGWGAMAAGEAEREDVQAHATARTVATPIAQTVATPLTAVALVPSAFDFIRRLAAEPAQPEPGPAVPAADPGGQGKAPEPEKSPFLDRPGRFLEPPPEVSSPAVPNSGRPVDLELNEPDDRASATTFAIDLRARGHLLLTRDGRFFVSESSRLTAEDREAIKLHRDALIAMATPWVEVPPPIPIAPALTLAELAAEEKGQSLAQFLGSEPQRANPDWRPDEPPDLTGIDSIVLNFATNGLDWRNGARPVGLTVGTLDGQLTRFLPFAFEGGGNLDPDVVKRWYQEQVRGKHILNANTRFELHMSRAWGVDLEEQGNTFSDIMHTAALLDGTRKRFALDVLATDYLGGVEVPRVDERNHAAYAAWEVAERERYSVQTVGKLRDALYPQLAEQDLMDVQRLEDEVIPVVVEMEKNGSPVDMELLDQFDIETKRRHDALMMEISREAGFAFEHTASGWKRMFEHLGLPSTDSYAENVVGAIDHPLVVKGHFAAQLASLNSKTFAAYKKQIGADGILYYDINQLRGDDGGTVSGRFSFGYIQQTPNHDNHHVVFGTGLVDDCDGSCDFFPRRLFNAAPGEYLIEGDAAQIEYRLFAHFANNPAVLAAYKADPWMSFHKHMWAMLKTHKSDMLYTHTKSFNFAKQYGAKSIKLATMMGFITASDGEEIRRAKRWNDPKLDQIHEIEAAFKKAMPEGDYLLDRAAHLAKPFCDDYCRKGDKLHKEFPHRGYVKTICGRRSRFADGYKTYIGLNRVIQGSASDIMKRKLVELHKARKQTGFTLRRTVHDSAGGSASDPRTKTLVAEILNAQSFPQLKVDILWDVKTGLNWAGCK